MTIPPETARKTATDFLNALASKRATKAYHDAVMARAVPGDGVTDEMAKVAEKAANAAVRLYAECSWAKMEILAMFVLQTLEKRPCSAECLGTCSSGAAQDSSPRERG